MTERYVGHAPRSIAERHYFGSRGDRLFELYLKEIVVPVNKVIEIARLLHDEKKIVEIQERIG